MSNRHIFKVGDRASFGGLEGVVVETNEFDDDFPVNWVSDNKRECGGFTADGRFCISHTEPLLKFISRPKKTVTKTIERWVNVWNDKMLSLGYRTKEEALKEADEDSVTVKLTGSYEIEIDE